MTEATIAVPELRLTIHELTGDRWESLSVSSPDEVVELINSPKLIWVGLDAGPAEASILLQELVARCSALEGVNPTKLLEGEGNPPARPPKAKAFRGCVFARAYELHVDDARAHGEDLALRVDEVHMIAGETFALTIHYRSLEWRLAKLDVAPRGLTEPGNRISSERTREEVLRYRRRLPESEMTDPIGLMVVATLLDRVVDSTFEALNDLREASDLLELDIMEGDWLWRTRRATDGMPFDQQAVRLRRLLRQVRWAFLPSGEITEFCEGPFLGLEGRSPALADRFDDLAREADRAIGSVHDVTEQVQAAVDLIDSMKTDRLNSTMYVLTAVATVLLIPTLIAGIYGMNFRHMPELSWRLGYAETLGLMVVLGGGVWFGIRWYLRFQHKPRSRPSRSA
jgi:CorA-like Mg2+ transporter protein